MNLWLGRFRQPKSSATLLFYRERKCSGLVQIILGVTLVLVTLIEPAAGAEPVLLVGNSFTGETYKQISDRAIFKERWIGGYNLDDHYRDQATLSSICAGRNFVLLQDFSTRARTLDLLLFDMDEMIPYVRSCKAQPVLFMTWETASVDFGTVRNGYVEAALRHKVQIVPVGLVFNRVRAASESMYQSFIQPDGKHPTVRGSKVSAASILKAFCADCYARFNWSGFSTSEISLIKGIINANVSAVLLNETFEVEMPPVGEDPSRAYMSAIVSYLLDG